MASDKTWADQPDEVTTADKLGDFWLEQGKREAAVEIRVNRSPDGLVRHWYLTYGTLVKSETVKCETAAIVLLVLCAIGRSPTLPSGAVLVK